MGLITANGGGTIGDFDLGGAGRLGRFEVMRGERENKDGSKGDAVRFQSMVKVELN